MLFKYEGTLIWLSFIEAFNVSKHTYLIKYIFRAFHNTQSNTQSSISRGKYMEHFMQIKYFIVP